MKNSILLVAVIVAGCTSKADDLTLDGADDLKRCDIRSANDKFTQAHAEDPAHPQAALGFALTSLALLPEAPEVTAILTRVGFTSALDMQTLVFGPEGLLARSARGDTCASIDEFVNAKVPYPPLATPSIDAWSLVDPALAGTDFFIGALSLSPRLGAIAEALDTAASAMTEPVEIEGGCGLGKVTFQAPELYALAALIEAARSATHLGQAYDWAVAVRTMLDLRTADANTVVALMNAHLGRVINAPAGAAASPLLRRSLQHLVRAVDSAKLAATTPNGLFDWTKMPVSLLDNVRRLAVAGQGMLDGATEVPDVMPTTTLDLTSMFATPIDLQSFAEPLFVAFDAQSWDLQTGVFELATGPLFSPDPFTSTATVTWSLQDQWSAFDATPVTMPFDRYQTAFDCTATP